MSAEPLIATRTYLEMNDRGALRRGRPVNVNAVLTRSDPCPPDYWRHLYATVGAAYRWLDRLPWTDEEITRYLDDPGVSLWVMTVGEELAGYYELRREPDDSFEIVYFGLMPAFTGQGLGSFLLADAVERAWSLGARRIWLHTSTFDHPYPIANYEARGFTVYKTEEYEVREQ